MSLAIPLVIGGAFVGSHLYDVTMRRTYNAKKARQYADSAKKPMLNFGSGTNKSSLWGPTLYGDINMDIAAEKEPIRNIIKNPFNYEKKVVFGDVETLKQFPNKFFGSALASHVIEHVDNPDELSYQLNRVAEKVFIVIPKCWLPTGWYWQHKWMWINGKKYPFVQNEKINSIQAKSLILPGALALLAYSTLRRKK